MSSVTDVKADLKALLKSALDEGAVIALESLADVLNGLALFCEDDQKDTDLIAGLRHAAEVATYMKEAIQNGQEVS